MDDEWKYRNIQHFHDKKCVFWQCFWKLLLSSRPIESLVRIKLRNTVYVLAADVALQLNSSWIYKASSFPNSILTRLTDCEHLEKFILFSTHGVYHYWEQTDPSLAVYPKENIPNSLGPCLCVFMFALLLFLDSERLVPDMSPVQINFYTICLVWPEWAGCGVGRGSEGY